MGASAGRDFAPRGVVCGRFYRLIRNASLARPLAIDMFQARRRVTGELDRLHRGAALLRTPNAEGDRQSSNLDTPIRRADARGGTTSVTTWFTSQRTLRPAGPSSESQRTVGRRLHATSCSRSSGRGSSFLVAHSATPDMFRVSAPRRSACASARCRLGSCSAWPSVEARAAESRSSALGSRSAVAHRSGTSRIAADGHGTSCHHERGDGRWCRSGRSHLEDHPVRGHGGACVRLPLGARVAPRWHARVPA